MSEKTGIDVVIKISGSATTFTAEATSTSDNTVYQITNTAKQVWDMDTTPTVLDDGVATAEAYTINKLNGKITFGSADAGRVITVTGKYLPLTVAAYAHEAKTTESCTLHDVTPFGSAYVKRKAGQRAASGALNQFEISDAYYTDALIAGKPVVMEVRDDDTSEPNRYWALLNSVELQAKLDGIQDQVITWESYDSWIKLGV